MIKLVEKEKQPFEQAFEKMETEVNTTINQYYDLQRKLEERIDKEDISINVYIDIKETMIRLDKVIRKQKTYKKQMAAYSQAIQIFEDYMEELNNLTR